MQWDGTGDSARSNHRVPKLKASNWHCDKLTSTPCRSYEDSEHKYEFLTSQENGDALPQFLVVARIIRVAAALGHPKGVPVVNVTGSRALKMECQNVESLLVSRSVLSHPHSSAEANDSFVFWTLSLQDHRSMEHRDSLLLRGLW